MATYNNTITLLTKKRKNQRNAVTQIRKPNQKRTPA